MDPSAILIVLSFLQELINGDYSTDSSFSIIVLSQSVPDFKIVKKYNGTICMAVSFLSICCL